MIKITGLDNAKKLLDKPKHIKTNKILRLVGEKILELAEPKLPVKDGILKSTGTVINEGISVTVGYNTEYAAYQHEGRRQDGSHIIRNRPGGGESHFLSGTVVKNKDQLLEFAKEQISKLLL